MSQRQPPWLAELWLRTVLPAEVANALCGDLAEEYQRIARIRRWPACWYYWEAACVTGRYLREAASVSPASCRSVVLGIGQDLSLGIRALSKAPLFSVFVIVTLALTIGVNTTVVSIVHAALLRPFPYAEPGGLVQIESTEPLKGIRTTESSYLTFLEWQQRERSFDGLAAYVTFGLNLAGDTSAEPVQTTFASASLFPILGIEPVLGRVYSAEDDQPGGDIYQVVISHALWQRRFGGAPNAIGRRVLLDMEAYTIVGVMPPGFGFPFHSDAWAPAERWSYRASPGLRSHRVIGRLSRTSTLADARSEMDAIALSLAQEFPKTHDGVRAAVVSLRDAEIGTMKPYFLVLLGAAGLLLLIACANVANLMLVRGVKRIPEFAVRKALGMSRWRMLRQLLAENLVLGTLGGMVGFSMALAGVAKLPDAIPIELPFWLTIEPDATLLIACLGITLTTTVMFGWLPTLAQAPGDQVAQLKSGRGAVGGTGRIRQVLTGLQIALSLVLLAVAGLLIKTVVSLNNEDTGFRSDHLLTAHLSLAYDKFPKGTPASERITRQTMSLRHMTEQLRALPGVVHVGGASRVPFEPPGSRSQTQVTADGQGKAEQERNPYSDRLMVSPDYFRTLEIPLVAGRTFEDSDRFDRPPVAIVNQSLAKRLWTNEGALGKRFKFGPVEESRPWLEVVGVVGDVKHRSLDAPAELVAYVPDGQSYPGTYTFVLRSEGRHPSASDVRRAIGVVDPQQAVFDVRSMDQLIARTTWQRRLAAVLLSVFAGLALLLAVLGIYGVLSHIVVQRTREIGLRLALGAQFTSVVGLVLRQSLAMIAGGLIAGLVMVAVVSHALSDVLFGVAPGDPFTLVTVTTILAAVALGACYVPARRAAKADLRTVLRQD